MTNEAADRVKQIREYLSKMTPGPWEEKCGILKHYVSSADDNFSFSHQELHYMDGHLTNSHNDCIGIAALRTDAEWLLSQLSASEERVRDSFNEGILAAANRLGELMLHSPKHDRELLINAVLELRRQKEAESLLPSPPQVIRG